MATGRDSRQAKTKLFDALATVSAGFSSARRLELIDVLAQGPRSVETLARATDLSVANTSQHLQRLKRAGLVTDERHGATAEYRLAGADIARLWLRLRDLAAQRNAEVARALDQYRPRHNRLPTVPVEEALDQLARGRAVLIDVRPPEEFATAHLPGAVNVPPEQVEGWSATQPAGQTVIAYCRGPYCRFADDALTVLAARGFPVARLELGVLEWLDRAKPRRRRMPTTARPG